MELALSLGDASLSLPTFLTMAPPTTVSRHDFCMALGVGRSPSNEVRASGDTAKERSADVVGGSSSFLQLDLLPFSPGIRGATGPAIGSSDFRLPWLVEHFGGEPEILTGREKHLDVNRRPDAMEDGDAAAARSSSPNSAASSFRMDFGIAISGRGSRRSDMDCSRGSDEDENASTRKKLRLSKDQSAFLEESFKEHSTLNTKQKIALAKQLSLRPRQVEVWFQNRRARTKLKQTEIDCEYLKRCCETLTDENRRLQKELQDLRALKAARPFYMQSPATTLTMCPSCERTIPASSSPTPKPSRVHGQGK